MSKKKNKKKQQKPKKEKITYIDDNSTVADMNVDGLRWYNKGAEPKPSSTFKDKAKTFFSTMKLMLIPMTITLSIMLVLYLLVLLIAKLA